MADPWEADWSTPQTAAPAPWEADWSKGTPEPAAPTWADSAKDAAQTVLPSLARGVIGLAGLPGDISNAETNLSGWLAKKIGADPEATDKQVAAAKASPLSLPTSAGLTDKVEGALFPPTLSDLVTGGGRGHFHQPTTGLGKTVDAIGQMAPGALMGPGGVVRNLARFAAVPGAASEGAGQLADQATSLPDWAAPAIRGATSVLASARLPFRSASPPDRQAFVNTLNNEGVTALTAGQEKGRKPLQWTESALADTPFSGTSAEDINLRAAGQLTRAAGTRAGINSDRLTPEVMDANYRRLGKEVETLSARNRMEGDTQLGNDLQAASHQYQELVNPSARAPIVDNVIRELGDAIPANGGSLPGATYQSLRSRLRAAASNSNDPHLSHALSDMTEALDDAMARSIQANNPADIGRFETFRRQYRNQQVLDKAVGGAGAGNAFGLISPGGSLANAAKVVQGPKAYVRGQGDFADLARASDAIMKPLPQSGTAPRENVMHNLQLGGILAGGAMGGVGGAAASKEDPYGTVGGALAGIILPGMVGRGILHPRVQNYLRAQPPPGLFSTVPGVTNAAQKAAGLFNP